tara:strand:+ start:48 stop:887 length:840 start_codon:yes stop_codon:yes gene_type:complete
MKTKREKLLEQNTITWDTGWWKKKIRLVALYAANRTGLIAEFDTDCGRTISFKIHQSKIEDSTFRNTQLQSGTIIEGVHEQEFLCVRCASIHHRNFARQKGDSGGSKCKNCYNLGRQEERQNNQQARIRARLASALNQFIRKTPKRLIQKCNTIRDVLDDLGNDASFKEVSSYILNNNNIKISYKDFYNAKTRKSRFKPTIITDYIGCSRDFFIDWIESQLEDDWNWDNRGELWELDHIIPFNSVDLTNKENVYKVMNYKNTRPLSILENRQKGNKACQ